MFLMLEYPHVHLRYVFIFDVPTFWINAFTLYLALENPIFPYLSQLFPEFGANRIEKSVLDCFNGFMLTHILWDHF